MSKRIGVLIDGRLTIHAAPSAGGYDTLCGIDADDEAVGHERAAEAPDDDHPIDCPQCKGIWMVAKQYTKKDFRP